MLETFESNTGESQLSSANHENATSRRNTHLTMKNQITKTPILIL